MSLGMAAERGGGGSGQFGSTVSMPVPSAVSVPSPLSASLSPGASVGTERHVKALRSAARRAVGMSQLIRTKELYDVTLGALSGCDVTGDTVYIG